MLKIIVIVIGFFMACTSMCDYSKLKRQVDLLDIQAVKKFDPYAKDWDLTANGLRRLKKVLREQGIATDYTSERKLDFSECKKTDEEYKKEAEVITSGLKLKDNNEDFENLTIFEEVKIGPLKKDPREKQFRCNKCSTVYPLNITVQHNIKYCSYCGKKIAYFKFLDYWKD